MPRSREELVEALTELKRREENRAGLLGNSTAMMLTEARDLLASLEEREEFRVVGTELRTGRDWEGEPRRERPKPGRLSQVRVSNVNVRVQSRTVTETPWTDVEEGTGGE